MNNAADDVNVMLCAEQKRREVRIRFKGNADSDGFRFFIMNLLRCQRLLISSILLLIVSVFVQRCATNRSPSIGMGRSCVFSFPYKLEKFGSFAFGPVSERVPVVVVFSFKISFAQTKVVHSSIVASQSK